MNHGIKMSKVGKSVDTIAPNKAENAKDEQSLSTPPHIYYATMMSYYFGARKQVERYLEAALIEDAVIKVQNCIHEASTLFEDLSTIGKYTDFCGDTHELNKTWLDIRNHIRHDVREGMDVEDDTRKNARAERLGIHPNLQMEISFQEDSITIGKTIVTIQDVKSYLDWSEIVIENVMTKAIDDGYIKGMSYTK